MKKLLMVVALMFSVGAFAFDGTVNDTKSHWVASAKFYANDYESFDNVAWMQFARMQGLIKGASAVFDHAAYAAAICYPEGSDADQLHRIATNYVAKHPEKWHEQNTTVVWLAHYEAWGLRADPDCSQ